MQERSARIPKSNFGFRDWARSPPLPSPDERSPRVDRFLIDNWSIFQENIDG